MFTASLKDALAKEKSYEQFSNTESEKEHQRQKQQKRKHPVTFDLIDANNEFDAVKSTGKIMFFFLYTFLDCLIYRKHEKDC